MFVFKKPAHSEARAVEVLRKDGQPASLLLCFKLQGPRERRAIIDQAVRHQWTDAELLAQVIGGWERMVDEVKQPVPCDVQHIAALLDGLEDGAANVLCEQWVQACTEAARGN